MTTTTDTGGRGDARKPAELLRVTDLTVAFDGLRAVDGVSFSVPDGMLYGVIGPNGAGKTTLLNGICGVHPPAAGEVWLAEDRLDTLRIHSIAARGVARTFQAAEVFNEFRVVDYLLVGRLRHQVTSLAACALRLPAVRRVERRERARAGDLLDRFRIGDLRDADLRSLSYGQRKLVDLLRALFAQPRLLLLDEPTSGTSLEDRILLRGALSEARRQGVTTIVVDHDVRFITDSCDRVLVMNVGRALAEGAPAEVLSRPEVVQAYIGGGPPAR